ncbi:hypothetical protein WA026_021953 [Henosepilachna vigintioctopunctata]|uniref:Uncharacterized protein n=1 Tax=Henosepilachna vigintioctopunctata TaxID=420089 RepID=A0AAW1VH86_9CUCU
MMQINLKKFAIKRNVDLISRLRPVAAALNEMQSNTCGLADFVIIWKKLLSVFEEEEGCKIRNFDLNIIKRVIIRYKQAITPAHC